MWKWKCRWNGGTLKIQIVDGRCEGYIDVECSNVLVEDVGFCFVSAVKEKEVEKLGIK